MYKIYVFVYIFIFIYKKQDMIKNIFIEKANKIHNSLYSYILNNENICYKDKINILCKKHGIFSLTVNNHLSGRGCPYCKIEENKNNFINKQLCNFINKAKQVHGDKYDYSKVNYVNAHTKVCIICPKHGEFWQRPNDHLSGYGCILCKESKLERKLSLFLDKKNIKYIRQYYPPFLSEKYSHQSLDFYLPDYNIVIECQGRQHFEPIKYFGENDKLKKQILLDTIKKEKCELNKVNIIYLIDSHINLISIINNVNYNNIYSENNSFKSMNKLLKIILK